MNSFRLLQQLLDDKSIINALILRNNKHVKTGLQHEGINHIKKLQHIICHTSSTPSHTRRCRHPDLNIKKKRIPAMFTPIRKVA